MTEPFTHTWSIITGLPAVVGWTTIGALLAALVGAIVALWNTRRTLAVQKLVANRGAASFIAEKRQKWIDELRADMATHLAESQEILWKWDAVRQRCVSVNIDESLTPSQRTKKINDIAEEFSKSNGDLDRSHQERHHRLRFRLNPKEANHKVLRGHLDEMRELFDKTSKIEDKDVAIALIHRMEELVRLSDELTNTILKTEWERVKQEVAYPAQMIAKIPPPV